MTSDDSSAIAPHADLIVVGAGIVGLAHAWHAVLRGMSVIVIERDERAVGASIRNFGHLCATAQSGLALEYAMDARETWLQAGAVAGIPVRTDGTVVLARTQAEADVLEEFHALRDDAVRMLTPAEAARLAGFDSPGLVAGAHLPLDLRVDSPDAIPALAAAIAERGADLRYGENVLEISGGLVRTNRREYTAETVVLAVGHDVDRHYPELAAEAGVQRCRLRMMEIEAPSGMTVAPGVFTGTSLLRYDGFASTDSAQRVRAELAESAPELLENTVNLMFTQRANGRIVIGDTHHYDTTLTPFEAEEVDELLLDQFRLLFGVPDLTVLRRWRGVYASAPTGPFLMASPEPGVVVASVTSGIGMTTGFGLARAVLDELVSSRQAHTAA
ncbi:TIGR03364 family FAD-dependent oxidoreductase [Humibacter ginsenosidimutans]|uniref:TIGR03364 family FAD-dependent oxidoreductase n=1 Tax=Humibacter ginsenosidimutans TaxID=2599293 RepID=UPI001FF04BAC|nr:TIGR03364 family FAD-dependent oxidoreductase [Humibacter ginsenosidimutans]